MNKVTGVIQVGVKGSDIVMSTLSKANALKDRLTKPGKISLSAIGGAASDMQQKKQEEKESKLGEAAKGAANELVGMTKTAASLDPGAMMQGIAGSLGRAANAINIPGMGLVSAAAEVAGAGIAAAGNALNAVKTALPQAIDTLEKTGRIAQFGGSNIASGGGYSLAEQSSLIEGMVSKFGRIGDKFGASVKRLVDAGVDLQQIQAVSQGNFGAMGTDEGFFLNKISAGFQGLPPSMGQELTSQLIDGLDLKSLNKDMAASQRKTSATMDTSDRAASLQISENGRVVALNQSMNDLRVTMVSSGAALSGMVASFGNAINRVLSELPGMIKDSKVAASDWRSYIPGLGGNVAADQYKARQAKAKQGQR